MRIGVIGTGIAGLTAAWLLKQRGADVTVFEKQDRLGMDAHGVEFEIDGSRIRSDVPPRMFNDSLWPNLSRLYREIGVESVSVEPSKSFVRLNRTSPSRIKSDSLLLKLGASFQAKLTPRLLLNKATRQILGDITRMMSEAPTAIEHQIDTTMALYLKDNQYSDPFVYQFLYPALSSTVCTCSYATLDNYPAVILLGAMMRLIQPQTLQRTRHGTQDVVQRLTEGLNDVRLGASVSAVTQERSGAAVTVSTGDLIEFDHLIIATQANSARRMLDPNMKREAEMLGHFRYENVPVVVHTDLRLMPSRKKDWSHFNLMSDADLRHAMCSIWMNRFCPAWPIRTDVFQTIMPLSVVQPDLIIATAQMQRPVVDSQSLQGLELMDDLHSETGRRVWFCGSYASRGIPLLESGVISAQRVAERVGSPWQGGCSVI